ncbi:MAG: hypothetical protein WB992_13705 [Bryobacteraceae bacterium]
MSVQEKARAILTGSAGLFNNSKLLYIARALLAVAFARQSFFRAAFLSRLEVKRMPLDFFYNVFLLHLTLETA